MLFRIPSLVIFGNDLACLKNYGLITRDSIKLIIILSINFGAKIES